MSPMQISGFNKIISLSEEEIFLKKIEKKMFPVDLDYKKIKIKILMRERKHCRSETYIYIKRGKW